MAGGTALALQIGHRQSVDLDFFTPQPNFKETILERHLLNTKKWTTSLRQSGTIYGKFMGAKLSFIAYPFFKPSKQYLHFGAMRILFPKDVAAMKIIAISQRGKKRDFIDLYWYCNNSEPLYNVIFRAVNQYPGQDENINHILRSLMYFDDAEKDPMPKLFFKATWSQIKKYFQKEVPKITRDFFGLR